MRSFLLLFATLSLGALAGEPAPTFASNAKLTAIPEKTAIVVNEGYKSRQGVLDYSGMVYDQHRHKILAFGGGHATAFPTSVHEFDFEKLQWSQVTEDVPLAEFNTENAVLDKDGKGMGGVKYKGQLVAASRHTYDGLTMAPAQDLMLCVQMVSGAGLGYGLDAKVFASHYTGTGLWIFDPVKKEWSVSKANGLALNHGGSATSPKEPDWVYFYDATGKFRAVNWKTEDLKDLGKVPKEMCYSYASLDYYPEEEALVAFPRGPKEAGGKNLVICKFDLKSQKWSTVNVQGDAPGTYDVNVVYDARNQVFVCYDNKSDFHYFHPRENRWHKVEVGVQGVSDIRHHHIYDPVDNVHIVTGNRWKTIAFKLSDEPGKLSGTAK